MTKIRCSWVNDEPLDIDYHDKEWGVPIYDERLLFEFLILEGAQAGLNWFTILKKRENYRAAFDNFNAEKMANYDLNKFNALMDDKGIIRNRLKVQAAITNARAFLKIKEEEGCFSDYIWQFVDRKPIKNHWEHASQVPATSMISKTMAKDLKKRGFTFVGDTICYAFMQATGMVNDHTIDCFCYNRP